MMATGDCHGVGSTIEEILHTEDHDNTFYSASSILWGMVVAMLLGCSMRLGTGYGFGAAFKQGRLCRVFTF